jgi:hypothetical protein
MLLLSTKETQKERRKKREKKKQRERRSKEKPRNIVQCTVFLNFLLKVLSSEMDQAESRLIR